MNQQDQVVFRIQISGDNLVIESVQHDVILEFTVPQCQKSLLMPAGHFLFQGKFQIQKVPADGAGQGFFKDINIFKHFFIGKGEEGFSHLELFFFVTIHVAAADPVDTAVVFYK